MALVQATASLEVTEPFIAPAQLAAPEVLDENRFLAARDGVSAKLIDVVRETRVPFAEHLRPLLEACIPHARALGCGNELDRVWSLLENPGAQRQLDTARGAPDRLPGLVRELSAAFCDGPGAPGAAGPHVSASGEAVPAPGSPH